MQVPVAKKSVSEREIEEAKKALDEGIWTEGRYCHKFSSQLKEAVGRKHCQLVNSGSSANFIALAATKQAYSWQDGDEIITCALGFPTTVAPIIQLGLKPVFVDATGLNIDADLVEKKITPQTRAIMVAHTLGFPFDYKKLRRLCNRYDLKLIEDTCLAKGTNVSTDRGSVKIENLKVGDKVLTRKGYKKVVRIINKGAREVVKNLGVTATADHRFITSRGEKEFTQLKPSDIIYIWNEKLSTIMEVPIIDILWQRQGTGGYITGDIMADYQRHYIERFGRTILEKFKRGLLSTIKTATPPIISLKTLSFSERATMPDTISKGKMLLRKRSGISSSHDPRQLNGIKMRGTENFILGLGKCLGEIKRNFQKFVSSVVVNMKHIFPAVPSTALKFVNGGVAQVYDIEVEDAHEFFANNILVHNCDAIGSSVDGVACGSMGDVSTFSFYPAHCLTTIEGGAVMTDDIKIFAIARSLTNWGRACYCEPGHDNTCGHRFDYQLGRLPKGWDHKYTYLYAGWNLKMNDVEAAIGSVQISKLENFVKVRRSNYQEYASRIIYESEPLPEGANPFGFVIYSESSLELIKKLTEHGIGARLVMGGNLLRQPFLKDYANPDEFVGADYTANTALWIGVQPSLSQEEKEYVIATINKL